MEVEFPIPNQLLTQYCFLTDLEGHERLVQDLDQAVLLYSTSPTLQLNRAQVCRTLVERYGGTTANWRIRSVPRGFLIYLPQWLYRDELNLDSHYWERHNFILQPWQALNGSDPLPTLHRVHLTILDFPLDYWHPFYFRQAMASIGFVKGIQRECLNGEDSTAIRLWLDTPDTSLIPFQLMVGHQDRWTACQILMEGRLEPPQEFSPPPPPHLPDSDEVDDSPPWSGSPDPLFIPPWRRRVLQIRIPEHDPSRRGAPSAGCHAPRFRLTTSRNAPGPQGYQLSLATVKGSSQLLLSAKLRLLQTNQGYSKWKLLPRFTPDLSGKDMCPRMLSERTECFEVFLPFYPQTKCKNKDPSSFIPQVIPPHVMTKQYPNQPIWHPSLLVTCPLNCSQTILKQQFPIPLSNHISTAHNSSHKHLLFSQNTLTSSLLNPTMTSITEEDEALIQRFIGLHTEDSQGPSLRVPNSATSSTDWSRCLLSRVVSDRTAIESQFQVAMMKAWDADPKTVFRSVTKNAFLIEFHDPIDLQTAIHQGPWTFKGELVALKMVSSHADVKPSEITQAALWVQLFNVPLNAFSEEGLILLGKEVGKPISRPIEGYVGGKRFYKIKVSIDLLKPLKDKARVTHPHLGEVTAHCVYEKVNRICVFCGLLGHEISSCADHSRLSTIMLNPDQASRFPAHQLLSPTRGLWITNATLIPRPEQAEPRQNLKRHFTQTKTAGPQQSPGLGPILSSPSESLNCLATVLEGETVPASSSSSQVKTKKPRSAGLDPLPQEL